MKTFKPTVPNRFAIKVTKDDQKVIEPEGKNLKKLYQRLIYFEDMQGKIDEIVANYEGCRCFVRPSGTENYVKIFVEGNNMDEIMAIGEAVTQIVVSHPALQ